MKDHKEKLIVAEDSLKVDIQRVVVWVAACVAVCILACVAMCVAFCCSASEAKLKDHKEKLKVAEDSLQADIQCVAVCDAFCFSASEGYGVATISRLLKISCLFCKRAI